MDTEFIDITSDNIESEHLCCIIRTKKPHSGVEAKRNWLKQRLNEGHVFRKLNIKGCVFIEYAPLETAWVPIIGENYFYIYCLWVQGNPKGCGYGRRLLEFCIADAKKQGKSGICMLGANKQKSWLSDQKFAKKYGFETVDTAGEYELLALSFNDNLPQFAPSAKRQTIDSKNLTVYYDVQCPYIPQRIEKLREYCTANSISADFIQVTTLRQAKTLPCAFNNWAVFYNGKFVTVNQIDGTALQRIMGR